MLLSKFPPLLLHNPANQPVLRHSWEKPDSMAQLKPEDIEKSVEERIAAYMDRLLNATGPSTAPSRADEEPPEMPEKGGISVSDVEIPEKANDKVAHSDRAEYPLA